MKRQFFVYIMADDNHKMLYIAVASDLNKRVRQHKAGNFSALGFDYELKKLLYYEIWDTAEAASRRAQQLKRWHRQWKLNLIEEINPELEDLPMP